MKKIKLQPRIQVELNTFNGGKLGTVTVLSDFDHYALHQPEIIEKVLTDMTRSLIDKLMILGAEKLVEKKKSL